MPNKFDRWLVASALASFVVLALAFATLLVFQLEVNITTQNIIKNALVAGQKDQAITAIHAKSNSQILERNDRDLEREDTLLKQILAYLDK